MFSEVFHNRITSSTGGRGDIVLVAGRHDWRAVCSAWRKPYITYFSKLSVGEIQALRELEHFRGISKQLPCVRTGVYGENSFIYVGDHDECLMRVGDKEWQDWRQDPEGNWYAA